MVRCLIVSSLVLVLAAADLEPPRLDGLPALHVLSARELVAMVDTRAAVAAAMDRRTDGESARLRQRWAKSAGTAKPDWTARRALEQLRARWHGQARLDAGETTLDQAQRWALVDGTGQWRPVALTRAAVGIDAGDEGLGDGTVRYVTAVYLGFERDLPVDEEVALRLDGREVARLRFAPDRTVSRAIKVNQVGYRPGDPLKMAYVGGWLQARGPLPLPDGARFALVDADSGAAVLEGPLTLRDDASPVPPKPNGTPHPVPVPLLTGERVWECDFTACDRPGRYYVRIPGVGRSWTFRIADDVYGEAFYVAMRGLLHQRASFALDPRWTAWPRPRFHAEPIGECGHIVFPPGDPHAPRGYERFDVIGATLDQRTVTRDVVGGWYDAADWDRNILHCNVVDDLLALYESRPDAFVDGQLDLPESGNGIPDLLDEAEFGLRVWLRSQDARGAVSGAVEARTHAAIDAPEPYAFARRTRYPTLRFAAAAAQFARLVRPFDRDLAFTYSQAARRALRFGADPANNLGAIRIPARRGRGTGEAYDLAWTETDAPLVPFLLAARLQVFLDGGDETDLLGLADLIAALPPPGVHPYAVTDSTPWIGAALLRELGPRLTPRLTRRLEDHYRTRAADLVASVDGMPYRMTWPRWQDWWMSWGATTVTNHNRFLFAADRVRPDPARLRAVLANAAASFGANPLGMCWTTGLGECHPAVLQHDWSARDGIADPVPGITVYGVTEGTYRQLREQVFGAVDADGAALRFAPEGDRPVWRRWSPHPTLNTPQCEFTVHETMSATILTCGMLMPAGWRPPPGRALRPPRPPDRLHGYWFLP